MGIVGREQEWLCRLASLDSSSPVPIVDPGCRWQQVVQAAIDSGVAPAVYYALCRSLGQVALPPDGMTRLREEYRRSVADHLRYGAILVKLVSALRCQGVETILVCGLAIATLHYPDSSLRPIRNLNLLIRVRDFPVIQSLLVDWDFQEEPTERGILPFDRGRKEYLQRSSGSVIRIHWECFIGEHDKAATWKRMGLHRLWSKLESVPVQGVGVNVLPLYDLFACLCLRQAGRQLERLLLFLDLHRMLTGPQRQKLVTEVLPDLIERSELRAAVHYSLKMTCSLFRTPGLEGAIAASRPKRALIRSLCRWRMPSDICRGDKPIAKIRRHLFRQGLKLVDVSGCRGKKLRVVLVSLNLSRNYNLAIEYLRSFALDHCDLNSCVRIHTLNIGRQFNKYLVVGWIVLFRPCAVGFSCYVWNVRETLQAARLLKQILPQVWVVLGGQEVTLRDPAFLEQYPFVDVVVNGEGEETFLDLLKHWDKHRRESPATVPGLLYRNNGHVIQTEARLPMNDLDRIPSPYLANRIPVRKGYRLGMMLETYRGCRFRCSFCFEGKKYRRLRSFSLDRLEREANHLFAKGARLFHIMDPVLGNQELENLATMCRIFQRLQDLAPCDISVEVFAELLNEKNIQYLKPFTIFDVGLQSVNPTVLKNIRRVHNREKFLRGVFLLKQLGRQVNLYLIMGLPGETAASYLEGIRFAIGVDPSYLFLNRLSVLSGTELRDRAGEFGLRYNRAPPYLIEETQDMTADEIRRLELFSEALAAEHNLKIDR